MSEVIISDMSINSAVSLHRVEKLKTRLVSVR